MEITEEEFQTWKRHPISKVFFQHLENTVQLIREQWSSGMFIRADDLHWTGSQNVHAYTKASTLEEVLSLTSEDIHG